MSFSQSVPVYKHAALDKPSGCPSTTVMQTMQVPVMLLKTVIWCLGSVPFKAQVQIHTMPFTLIVQVGGASWLKKERSVAAVSYTHLTLPTSVAV